jgi:hypothetical protein
LRTRHILSGLGSRLTGFWWTAHDGTASRFLFRPQDWYNTVQCLPNGGVAGTDGVKEGDEGKAVVMPKLEGKWAAPWMRR